MLFENLYIISIVSEGPKLESSNNNFSLFIESLSSSYLEKATIFPYYFSFLYSSSTFYFSSMYPLILKSLYWALSSSIQIVGSIVKTNSSSIILGVLLTNLNFSSVVAIDSEIKPFIDDSIIKGFYF